MLPATMPVTAIQNLPATAQTYARTYGQETEVIIRKATIRIVIIKTGIIRAATGGMADKNGVLICAVSRR